MRFAPYLPAAALLVTWVVWIPADGGYFPRQWLPAALFLAALLAAVVIAGRRVLPAGRWARAALALLAAATAWSFLSMLWAESDGRAWHSSDQLLLYLAVAWLAALVPWRERTALGFMGLWAVAVAVACGGELISALSASGLDHYLIESRWQQPTGYANGAAAIAAMGALAALAVSAHRSVPAPVQVVLAVAGAFLVEMAVLPQSRAALIAGPLALLLLLALSPDRGRLLGRFAVVGLALALAGGPVWDVYGEGEAGNRLAPALDRAAEAILLSLAVAAVAAAVLVLIERRVRAPALPRPPRAAALGVVAVLALGLLVAGAASSGKVSDYAGERWDEFRSESEAPPDENPSRLAQRNSDKRYDYWRVSLNALRDAPVGGLGAGGFEREYTEHRRYPKPSQAAHSIWMRALSETGVIGAVLLALLVAAIGAGLLAARRLGAGARAAVAAAGATGGYFLMHASLDWLELLPALAAPPIGFALAVLALRRETAQPHEAAEAAEAAAPGPMGPLRVGAVAVAGLAALAALAPPYLSVRHVESALGRPAAQAAEAERDLDRATALDPLSPEPHLVRARLALRRAEFDAAGAAFRDALEVEDGWYGHFGLALLASRAGDRAQARSEIARARRLNSRDPIVVRAQELIADGKRLDPNGTDRDTVSIQLYNDPDGH